MTVWTVDAAALHRNRFGYIGTSDGRHTVNQIRGAFDGDLGVSKWSLPRQGPSLTYAPPPGSTPPTGEVVIFEDKYTTLIPSTGWAWTARPVVETVAASDTIAALGFEHVVRQQTAALWVFQADTDPARRMAAVISAWANKPITHPVEPGSRIRFDGKTTSWLVRASTIDRRYTIATASLFGVVHYTIIDWEQRMRGPMNVIGGGLGIFTTSGPDPAIDEAIRMLEDTWEVSHRNAVWLSVTHEGKPL